MVGVAPNHPPLDVILADASVGKWSLWTVANVGECVLWLCCTYQAEGYQYSSGIVSNGCGKLI